MVSSLKRLRKYKKFVALGYQYDCEERKGQAMVSTYEEFFPLAVWHGGFRKEVKKLI